MAWDIKDYVDVHTRVAAFYEKYPGGVIQTEITHLTDTLVIVKAYAFRDGQDTKPCTGHSQLGIPGKTQFTRDSEVENCETSAVGRALAFMGFEVKNGIASNQEVQNKRGQEPDGTDIPDWINKAWAICNEKHIKFRDIPELKISPQQQTSAQVVLKLKIWANNLKPKPRNDEELLAAFRAITDGVVGESDAA